MAEVDVAEIISLTKCPDPIKNLPTYAGGKNLHHWIQTVDDVLNLFQAVAVASPNLYRTWVVAVRSKITGKAADQLAQKNIPNDWPRIREELIEIYADNRDLATLTQQIPYLKQKTRSIEEFYAEASELTSDINQKLTLDDRYQNHVAAVMLFVREMTKNAFIDGLNHPYNLTVRSARPTSLEAAKAAAVEQLQSMQRNQFSPGDQPKQNVASKLSFNKQGPSRQTNSQKPQFQGNRTQNQNFQYRPRVDNGFQSAFKQPFQGNSQNPNMNVQALPTTSQNFGYNNQNQHLSTPMDVDQSMRSRFTQRSRGNQIANAEFAEENAAEDSHESQEVGEDFFAEDANFLQADAEEQTG